MKRNMSSNDGNFSNKRGRGGGRGGRGGRGSGGRGSSTFPEKRDTAHINEGSQIVQLFKIFGEQLDDANDRRERLVKLSRDLTIGSKRLIFLLLRYADDTTVAGKAQEDLIRIKENIHKIGSEIQGHDYYKYHRAFSPGIQEFIESLTLFRFLQTGTLITKHNIEKEILETNPEKLHFLITDMDYLLGVADLTGELMRLCISSLAVGNEDYCNKVSLILREIYDGFSILPVNAGYELSKKMQVMKVCLQKVENACFQLKVRGSEIPKELLAEQLERGAEEEQPTENPYE